ncbi:MAG: response regulator [Desulfosarcina sp.]|nr:response regulator [Desulfosarcina sp.]MBC2766173.1 response regulator [Desulfosarcina sp.]
MTQATILVVEDEGIVAQEIKSRLEKTGYTVCAVAHDGETAVAHAGEMGPDLVLMDIRLKGEMDGIDAAGLIRDRFNIPVVYLTAYTDPATLERAKIMEPFGYVVKPFETRSLMVSIEIALHRHRSESERIYREKLQAVLETAGAICHELNQPMMAISGHTELLMETFDQNDPLYPKIARIKFQVERMGAITQKLMGITRYETKDYVQGERIVDIEKSSLTFD